MTISATSQGLKPGVCTSSNRPANPYDGMVIYETDTDKALVWNGSSWVVLSHTGAWSTYTPTLSQGGTTVTKTVNHARYMQFGKTVMGSVYMTATSAGSAGLTMRSSFPVTPVASIYNNTQSFGGSIGAGGFYKSTGAQYNFTVQCLGNGTDSLGFFADGSGGSLFGQYPTVTFASGDHIFFTFMYEAA